VGITTIEGDTVMFDEPERKQAMAIRPATVRNDTLYASIHGTPYSLSVDQVQRYWIRYLSTGRTIGLVAGIVGGAFLVVVLIAAATKESCPFIYSWDGTQWVFDAEPYGGATTRGLERDDFAELEHLVAVDGEYRIMITNEVPETQYTNLAKLVVVDHPAGTRIVADHYGRFHTVRSLVSPVEAQDERNRDLMSWLRSGDRLAWEPMPDPDGKQQRSEITLTFPKPPGAKTATLVARVGTGLWGSYMIKSMLELHGKEVDAWYAALDQRPSAVDSLFTWNLREELYALQVLVEEPDGWNVRGVLPGGGPFITEDRALVLDVSRVAGNQLRVRLRPPRGFWSLDAFAVNYGEPEFAGHVQGILPREARDQRGRDVLSALSATDDTYYPMPTNDDHAILTFEAPPPDGSLQRTVFLHARGWYRIHLDNNGTPERETLRRIAEVPGEAARYAAEQFLAWPSTVQ
jgi:hypothetical protein